MVNGIDYENKVGVCEALLGLQAFTGCDAQVVSESWEDKSTTSNAET